jgi:hypothetical protein
MAGLGKQTRGSGLAKVQRQEFGSGGSGRAYVPIDNDTILEQLYEKYLDQGKTPQEAEKLAKKEFDDKAK